MSSVTQTVYMTKMIREGYEAADVNLWQALLQQAKTDIGDSHEYVFLLLDMARHNKVGVLEIVKTGRVCSNEKAINQKFMHALFHAVASDDEVLVQESKHSKTTKQGTKVLDLTCDDESLSSSPSYEEEYNDNPTSAEAYEIDGFVVEDHVSEPNDDADVDNKPRKRLLKRKISIDEE